MGQKNCWEVMNCGKELKGKNSDRNDVCPVFLATNYEGINNGHGGGRFCWVVAGTFCDGDTAGNYSEKLANCVNCKFLKQVNTEEGRKFILTPRNINKVG